MTPNKNSLLVASQLPAFVTENPDYANFVLFLKAYYEWMEETGNVSDAAKNLLAYKDIDTTTDQFLQYFINDFLQYFPQNSLISKETAVKAARQLYQSKGTLASYQFLFRILYNSEFDLFNTGDAVLKASSGNWYVAKSLKLATTDPNFLNIANLRVFGETTKSIATIETSVLAGVKTEIFISNIERLFQSGEFVRIVDSNNQDVYFLNEQQVPAGTNGAEVLRAKLVGQLSQVNIDPLNRGLTYQVGDPVIVYGGLNPEIQFPVGAQASVGSVTAGSIQRINVISGGYGYSLSPTLGQAEPAGSDYTVINISGSDVSKANATVASIDPTPKTSANVTLIPIDSIVLSQSTTIGNSVYSFFSHNMSANANTTLANAFNFTSFTTYPISSVYVNNGGGGISQLPTVSPESVYVDNTGNLNDLGSLGILAPIQISNGGLGYRANDKIIISGGSGYGAYANVINVTSNGAIANVAYVYGPQLFPLGGLGYTLGNLPTLSVSSANNQAANASLFVPGILGQGAQFSVVTDRVGSITSINLTDPGEDYIATPNVSLKVQDIVVSNVFISSLPQSGQQVYQGANIGNATYTSTVSSITLLQPNALAGNSLYNLRVFNYSSNPNPSLVLKVANNNINMVMANSAFNSNYNSNGIRNYGDGTAKGSAKFLNGLVIGQGQYLNNKGQPSSFDVLQSENYNNYTYQITVEKEIEKYRDILLNLLHPAGTKVIGRYSLKSQANNNFSIVDTLYTGNNFSDYAGTNNPRLLLNGSFSNPSTNVISFTNIPSGETMSTLVPVGSTIRFTTPQGDKLGGFVNSANDVSNTITLTSNTWVVFGNVAYASGNSGQNHINITNITNSYGLVKGGADGLYYNLSPNITLGDIVRTGDNVRFTGANTYVVNNVDTINNIVYFTSNLTSTITNSLMSVNRSYTANAPQIQIFNSIGIPYLVELVAEDGITSITDESNNILLIE